MSAVDIIATAARSMGYRDEAVVRNYTFADVLDPADPTRTVLLAAFTQTPPSYRSAALAAVLGGTGDTLELVKAHRALGAPLLFVIEGDLVSLWQVRGDAPPRVLERLSASNLPALFERHQDTWRPDAIHRAKSIGAIDRSYQLDFVDIGLLPAVEGEIHLKLDRLLIDTLTAASEAQEGKKPETRLLFRVVFRLLAAKVLQDRRHPYAQGWDAADLSSVLRAIESYYSLPSVPIGGRQTVPAAFSAAWECLRHGISFANISSDDLAFVYENTFVTPEARKHFGTHSTPRQLAEYAVNRLELHRYKPEDLKVYEPFTGAGTFLVSALRHVRDLLPINWSDQQRHDFLVGSLAGDEIDPFACEVATLSLILADYPNQNGWHIAETDLFEKGVLQDRMRGQNVILCNPPFEAFAANERARYPIANQSYSKPVAVLAAALDARPLALAFVLPRPFILDRQFAEQRRKIETLYGNVELVELPDRIFGASVVESALLIAREPRPPAPAIIALRSTEVSDRDRVAFLRTGKTTTERQIVRAVGESPSGELWIPPLQTIWDYLAASPRLSRHFTIHRGIEWKSAQDAAWSTQRHAGYRRGLHTARGARQFLSAHPVWLDCRPERLLYKAIGLPWEQPKLIVNAGRLSRGPWRIAAALDNRGLLCSQQFFGLWPSEALSCTQLLTFAAILNGPVANAFLSVHSPAKGMRISAVAQIPLPSVLPYYAGELVAEYVRLLMEPTALNQNEERLEALLTQIDAAVLGAYDLSARLERQLLDHFRGVERPVVHPWQHWDAYDPTPGLTLSERASGRFQAYGSWIQSVFRPLPNEEAKLLRTYRA
ncbi:N-6 DNA methylase [Reyranella sp.]|uniref:N-6 DNA methylase n=1 Tax=Reyranella sp. TaxID=1929291 RepID=UPI002731F6FE|nr:N-6 DNA methylase [Reyranella sp.]MDP2374974.1 N-6 DNA methylase [Reyranella sp.]